MARLHAALGGASWAGEYASLASVRRRLRLARGRGNGHGDGQASGNGHDDASVPGHANGNGQAERPESDVDAQVATMPPVRRTPMAPTGWPAPVLASLIRSAGARPRSAQPADRATEPADPSDGGALTWTAALRRTIFTVLVLVQTAAFAYYMTEKILPYHGREPLELAILTIGTILFVWISLGFWTALSGFVLLCLGRDRHAITRSAAPGTPIPADARTAVIMPVCNEHVARVFAGLRGTYESLMATGEGAHFDFFILSDSSDPDTLTAERKAWFDLCTAVHGFGHIFYRWRRHRVKRKTGNVADFCRRWGSQYRYMVVMDADSVMSGECLATLVRLMEASPTAGIIQTAPRAAGRDTMYARAQQFATRVYGPLFTAGLHFWQLGESPYWGHNAIIRIAPFMRHCALGRLPGRGPLSGEILSHDFVEAALMRRAGWKVWMAYDLPGSYEEMPPNLLDELKRDRRWCKGNLINARLFLWQGLHPAHRAVFMTGVMTYVSAPLWLLSLALCTAFIVVDAVVGPQYFVEPRQLFPIWPEWDVVSAIGFAVGTGVVLFLPKVLGAVLVVARDVSRYGGVARFPLSLLLEMLFSALLAPIRMLFHTQFVIAALTGIRIQWKSPPREDTETTWGEAVRRHGPHTVLGAAWAVGVYWLAPSYTWWLMPVAGAVMLSIPLSVYSSRVALGRALRRARLLVIPEEVDPPLELRVVQQHVSRAQEAPGFVQAVVDPVTNAVACAAASLPTRRPPRVRLRREQIIAAALERGPASLTDRQRLFFLTDAVALSQLHFRVWTSPAAHPGWRTSARAGARNDGAELLDVSRPGCRATPCVLTS
jgi:membrane glycosyltransferase